MSVLVSKRDTKGFLQAASAHSRTTVLGEKEQSFDTNVEGLVGTVANMEADSHAPKLSMQALLFKRFAHSGSPTSRNCKFALALNSSVFTVSRK